LSSAADEPSVEIWLLHRLDNCTSGILLVADNERTAEYIKQLFRERDVEKTYVAAVFGEFKWLYLLWKDVITVSKDGSKALSRIPTSISSSSLSSSLPLKNKVVGTDREATTHVKLLKLNVQANISLIELRPLTGVTHQLRVQCQRHNLPIIGDRIYGSFSLNKTVASFGGKKNYMYLHAAEISLLVPTQKITSDYNDGSEGASRENQSDFTMFNVKADIPETFKDLFPVGF
jgi:23S rRNA-/tRNA-specific pseudouridylate synthase